MSAQIPETMLLSDLLKPTGYDCPEDLQGKTFAEATSGGDAKISTNTAKTIDVSAYTEPVVIEPAEGYDATKKVTVTLDNIPSPGGSATLYAWNLGTAIIYTKVATPTTSDKALVPATTGLIETAITGVGEGSITIEAGEYDRYSTGDITVA